MTETKGQTSVPNTAVGIDLGTSFCRVALWQNGKVTVIPNKFGNKNTPSYVAFGNTRRFFGEAAEEQMLVNNKNTIRAVKRLLGGKLQDKKIPEIVKLESFQLEEHEEQLKCNVDFKKETKLFAPEEVAAMLLMEMKEISEAHLGGNTKVKDAVITVPSYFNQFQRQATLNAATIAGLNVLRLINDPTAAALAYELNKEFIDVETTKKVMFYCFGGGSLSVSIVEIKNGSSFQVLATAGDAHFGGEDFDNKIVAYCMEQFEGKHKEDLSKDSKATSRLKVACEKAKQKLSSGIETTISIENVVDAIDLVTKVTRTRFENLCTDLFWKSMEPVEKTLKTAKLDKSEINDVVLVGGSTKIPKIQRLLQDYFDSKELITSNVDESVVYGAALQAAVLAETADTDGAVPKVEVVGVTPFSYDFTDAHDTTEINESNSKIPCILDTWIYSTAHDNQKEINIKEISEASSQLKIGSVRLTVQPAPAGESEAKCYFKIDANGILHVLQKLDGGATKEVLCAALGRHLSPGEILRMTADAVKYKEYDAQQRKLTSDRNKLEDCISNFKQELEEALKKTNSRYAQVTNLIDSDQLTDEAKVASQLEETKNYLSALVTKQAEILGLQCSLIRPQDQPVRTRTRGNGEPAAKKARPT